MAMDNNQNPEESSVDGTLILSTLEFPGWSINTLN